MIISFRCGAEMHRLRVSRRGSLTLLDYDAGHRARDVMAAIGEEPPSTCGSILRTLRTRAFVSYCEEDALNLLLSRHVSLRLARIRLPEDAISPVDGLLAAEMAACEFTGSWHMRTTRLQVNASTYTFSPVEFLRCRRRILGENALRYGVTMSTGVIYEDGSEPKRYLPLQLLPSGTVRVLVLYSGEGCYASSMSMSAFLRHRVRAGFTPSR